MLSPSVANPFSVKPFVLVRPLLPSTVRFPLSVTPLSVPLCPTNNVPVLTVAPPSAPPCSVSCSPEAWIVPTTLSVPPFRLTFSLDVKLLIVLVPDEYVIAGLPVSDGMTTSSPLVGSRSRLQFPGVCQEPPAGLIHVMVVGTVRSSNCSTPSLNRGPRPCLSNRASSRPKPNFQENLAMDEPSKSDD